MPVGELKNMDKEIDSEISKPTTIGVPPKSTKEEPMKDDCEGGKCGCKGCRRHKRGKLLLTVGIVAGLFLLLKD